MNYKSLVKKEKTSHELTELIINNHENLSSIWVYEVKNRLGSWQPNTKHNQKTKQAG